MCIGFVSQKGNSQNEEDNTLAWNLKLRQAIVLADTHIDGTEEGKQTTGVAYHDQLALFTKYVQHTFYVNKHKSAIHNLKS